MLTHVQTVCTRLSFPPTKESLGSRLMHTVNMLFRCYIFPHFILLDPTLTLPNLTALLEKVDWDKFGRWFLDVPDATLDMIHSSGGDASQCRQKCWEVYLNEHPAPSWKRVANGLYLVVYPVDYHEELEVIQKKYLKGE